MTIKSALIVDDSRSARTMLERLLGRMNVRTDAVDSAEAALQFLEKTTPDIIFMDHMMPGMDGLEATQRIKSNPRTATIPTIMYTSKEGDEYRHIARSHGAEGVLAKPASQEAVMAVIQALDKPAANDDLKNSNPTLHEVDLLVQKHLRVAITEARAQISAGLDTTTQQLQTHQTHQIDLLQARIHQQLERWQNSLRQEFNADQLWQKTRSQQQRMAVTVADKLDQKIRSDLQQQITQQQQLLNQLEQRQRQDHQALAHQSRHYLHLALTASLLSAAGAAAITWAILRFLP